mmetsp:Transcript_23690/g.42312  ORF Transcript_23690/g.42312 Transcript_23690/m.42312 type:complete len:182 (+) Transcript_23690:2605-3150(+)
MQEGRGVNELDRGGQMHVVRPVIATHMGRGERQHGAQTFPPCLDQMARHFGDAWRVFGRHTIPNEGIHSLHIRSQPGGQTVMRFRDLSCVHAHVPRALSTFRPRCPYIHDMKELLRSTDPTIIAFASALLEGEDIDCFQMDVNMSILEGGIGIFPRRLMVRADDHAAALRVMTDNDIDLGY